MNDDNQTPLDVARVNWRSNVVRSIENKYSHNPLDIDTLHFSALAVGWRFYRVDPDSQPRTLVALWNASMEALKFIQSDHAVIISDIPNSNNSST
ncbi:hypothetical protein RHMOL_Rhmol04G0292400 [Rhododendron molle]|uniref:Uncharacterized protein n=1 Tax=Rhododendron molle TaxID=49168 RepID=A0ACC0P870_RHOML|nr:hypothetical protein RHMOL_Rhmol04G0292400 [Rhododendron molle]